MFSIDFWVILGLRLNLKWEVRDQYTFGSSLIRIISFRSLMDVFSYTSRGSESITWQSTRIWSKIIAQFLATPLEFADTKSHECLRKSERLQRRKQVKGGEKLQQEKGIMMMPFNYSEPYNTIETTKRKNEFTKDIKNSRKSFLPPLLFLFL